MYNGTATIAAVSVSGVFCFASLVLTFFLVYRHLKHWIDPVGQTCIVRILLMVPVYALCSWLSLMVAQHTIYFNLVRDCYEAFVLYQFFSLLVHYFNSRMSAYGLGDDDASTGFYLSGFESYYHPFPICCLPPIIPGEAFYHRTKQFILQYVLVKPVLALVSMVLELLNLYDEGSTNPARGYIWITVVVNISMTLSLYYLLLFYDTISFEIEIYNPLYKLLAIKVLLFFLFWQSLAIATLYHYNVVPDFMTVAEHDILNNCLVCVEMFILSVANVWIFPYTIYRDGTPSSTLGKMARNVWKWVLDSDAIVKDTRESFL
jgi:hypothetical protein